MTPSEDEEPVGHESDGKDQRITRQQKLPHAVLRVFWVLRTHSSARSRPRNGRYWG